MNQTISEIANLRLSEFAEKYLNIKLNGYQKIILDNYNPKNRYYYLARGNNKKLRSYYNLCIHCSEMKDDESVVFVTTRGDIHMNKNELAKYLLNDYWK